MGLLLVHDDYMVRHGIRVLLKELTLIKHPTDKNTLIGKQ